NDSGRLTRIAPDGTQREVIAGTALDGTGGIGEFDVSLADGGLAYLEQRLAGGHSVGALVRADPDGGNPQALLEGDYFTSPRWSPDGAQLALGVMELIGGPPPTLDPGVYLIPASGGAPRLIQASDRARPEATTRVYVPRAWSPDGGRLLLKVYGPETGACDLAVIPADGGPLVAVTAPEGLIIDCDRTVWRADGGAIALNMFRRGFGMPEPGLWQADPSSGALTVLIPPQGPAGWTTVSSVGAALDGGWLALVAVTDEAPVEQQILERQLARIAADGAITLLRPEQYPLGWSIFAWAPDRSGVVAQRIAGVDDTPLLWLPLQGDIVELYPAGRSSRITVAWGGAGDDP
ncbi:MAG: hypothetical protein HGA45_26745, partial [Chloroflexales bacterium]|nr:hypothetical protein [Chloroflexales bacterium]